MTSEPQLETPGRSLPPLQYLTPAIGLLTGYLAVQVETQIHFAPVGIFPLVVGVATGIGVTALLRLAGIGRLRTHFVGATLAALVAVASMHYLEYREARSHSLKQADDYARMTQAFPQPGVLNNVPKPINDFGEFVSQDWLIGRPLGPMRVRGGWLGLWWAIDALLIWLGSSVTAVMFCDRAQKKGEQPAQDGGSETAPPGDAS